jgi:hypothetical protein
MSSTINASTASGGGVITTADASGILQLQTAGVTGLTIDASQNVKLSTAGTVIQNSSGRSILNQTGSVLQVVTGAYNTAVSTSSTTAISTGLTASITPSSTSSRILVIVTMGSIQNNNAGNGVNFSLLRNTTALASFGIVHGYFNMVSGSISALVEAGGGIVWTDIPATTSSTSYTVNFSPNTAGQTVTTQANGAYSTMVLMEIAG